MKDVLKPYQQRVIDEKDDLDDKRAKLAAFSQTDAYAQLAKEEQDRLDHQAFHMGAYSDILAARIAAF